MPRKVKVRDAIFPKILSAAQEAEKLLLQCAPEPLTLKELLQGVKCHIDLHDTLRKQFAPAMTTRKNLKGGKYADTTLREDVLEAEKNIGVHITSTTRKATLIQEHLILQYPEVSNRTIVRILNDKKPT